MIWLKKKPMLLLSLIKKLMPKIQILNLKSLLLIAFIFSFSHLFGQLNKNVKKAIETFNSGSIDKGISMMSKIVKKEPSTENWDILVNMYFERYKYATKNLSRELAVAIGRNMGANMKYKKYTNSNICFNDLVLKCKEASIYSQSTTASMLLRNFFVDYETDTTISKEATAEFQKGEEFFIKKDYTKAKQCYQNALDIEPNYFKAIIYLGDSHWYLDDLDSAIYYFNKGKNMHPNLLEPRKYLVDAYGYSKRNAEAKTECFEALSIYPDLSLFLKYNDLIKRENKTFNRHWTKRGCEINKIGHKESKVKNKAWSIYQSAKDDVKDKYDGNGILITTSQLTTAKYLEVYSWEKMFTSLKSIPEDLSFAKKMHDLGYLDCYIFISMFHIDLYPQYLDFTKNNKEKIRTYIETYLTE